MVQAIFRNLYGGRVKKLISFWLTSGYAVVKDKKRNELQAIFEDFAKKLMEISRTGNASLLQVR